MNAYGNRLFFLELVAYGSWFNHVKSWWKKKEEHPILFLHYEDMKEVNRNSFWIIPPLHPKGWGQGVIYIFNLIYGLKKCYDYFASSPCLLTQIFLRSLVTSSGESMTFLSSHTFSPLCLFWALFLFEILSYI